MGYLQFDKSQLINLEYSLRREIIRTNRAGSYASTTIIGCNTRKYHGLLVCPCQKGTRKKYILLSSLDATVVQHEQEFNLGIHKYEGDLYIPRGHKYVRDYQAELVDEAIYRVGGVVLKKERLLVEKHEQFLVKYSLLEAQSDTWLRIRPFLAFREIHDLSKANMYANQHYRNVKNGIASKIYDDFPFLFMQFSRNVEFVPVPDWYYNLEYMEEQKRGYDYKEDLYVPGYFEFRIKKGESVVFSGSTSEANPAYLKRKFTTEKNKRIARDSFKNCLLNSAEQFFCRREKETELMAGYPWLGSWSRDTFVSLPGLGMSTGHLTTTRAVIDSLITKYKNGIFLADEDDPSAVFKSVDTSLWFIWMLQKYSLYDKGTDIWGAWGGVIKSILNTYLKGQLETVKVQDNGLLWSGNKDLPSTWMDAITSEGPVTSRKGMAVEVNALWYNAIVVSLEWAGKKGDQRFVSSWKKIPEMLANSFLETFWDESNGYLADVVNEQGADFSVRPNQLIAAAMPHSPLTKNMVNSVLEVVENELLTDKGIRTLSPKHPDYKGIYEGNQHNRDMAYHQGSVWPWLLEFFVSAYLDIHQHSGLNMARKIFHSFEEDMTVYGIGSIPEIYDGDPPHYPRGTVSYARSVAALLRISEMIEIRELEMLNNAK